MRKDLMKLSGWGRYPEVEAEVFPCLAAAEVADCLSRGREWITHGLGRSYGDSALGGNVLLLTSMNRILSFDTDNGFLRCQAGASLESLIEAALPQGWFLPVTPGTKHVTVGGAIASDVHGKNHHRDGCFGSWVKSLELMLPGGEVVSCSHHENRELFLATCGGLGLTGVILTAIIEMRRVTSSFISGRTVSVRNLRELFNCFEEYAGWHYLVAWVDCLAGGADIGRALFSMGEHSSQGGLVSKKRRELVVPQNFPGWMLNKWSAKVFNALYFYLGNFQKGGSQLSGDNFFYPLDGLADWHQLYGRQGGLLQYQFVLPKESSYSGLQEVFNKIRQAGLPPFLAVLKLLGKENENLLTFPREGYTLALDFKAGSGVLALLDRLDRIVDDHGGRVYLSKDARLRPASLAAGYPRLDTFLRLREKYKLAETFQSLQSKRLGL